MATIEIRDDDGVVAKIARRNHEASIEAMPGAKCQWQALRNAVLALQEGGPVHTIPAIKDAPAAPVAALEGDDAPSVPRRRTRT